MIECKAPWQWVWIGIDGNVAFCCYQRARGTELILGNIYTDDINDILNGPMACAIRDQIKNEQLPEVCRGCPVYEVVKHQINDGHAECQERAKR